MAIKEERPRKRLDLERRKLIESGLTEGRTLTSIARDIDAEVSTVRREILRNRHNHGMSYSKGKDKTDCAHLKSCKIKSICDFFCENKLCKRCEMRRCQDICMDYERRICLTVEHAPFCCNACDRFGRCTLERWRYSAEMAEASARRRSHDARCGIDMTKEELDFLVETVRRGLIQGQSIHHIFETNDMPCSERTFYRYVEGEDIPILAIELAKKVKRKKRKQRKHDKKSSHKSDFYLGHEYEDYLALSDEDRSVTTEVDTVLGKKADRKCILTLHRIDLHFQIYLLLEAKTTECVVKALDWLEECSKGRFSEFFGLCLFDRGCEFDDIAGMERSKAGGGKRMSAYFADPSRPDQRASAEKNHVELRKILPKGTSFGDLDAFTLSGICSHVNSSVRKGCGDVSPMQLARLVLPKELLDNLGLQLIPPGDVIGAPGILYRP